MLPMFGVPKLISHAAESVEHDENEHGAHCRNCFDSLVSDVWVRDGGVWCSEDCAQTAADAKAYQARREPDEDMHAARAGR